LAIVAIVTVLGINSVIAADVPAGAKQVLDAVQHDKEFSLSALFQDEESFYYVMDRIAEGTEDWLDVAARLAPGADGHPGEELAHALSLALARAPEEVLSRSFDPIRLSCICRG
jgi:hypothetical protein